MDGPGFGARAESAAGSAPGKRRRGELPGHGAAVRIRLMALKQQVEEYRRRMEEFNRWESENPPPQKPAKAVLADLSFLLRYVSPDELMRDPDPEKVGVQKLRRALALAFERR